MCPRFKSNTPKKIFKKIKKKIKQRAHYKVCLLEEVCFHATERFQKLFEKKKRCTMTREETEVLSAKARLQWIPRRPRSLPYIPNAYKQPGRATKSSLNSYDSKQTNWDSIWAKLLVCFHPNTAAETLLKISVSSWVLRRCDWDKGGSVTSCSKAWC